MPRRHISQREAHANAKRLAKLERRLEDLSVPASLDSGCIASLRPLPVDERMRGYLEGLREGRTITLAARLTGDGIVLYAFREVAG